VDGGTILALDALVRDFYVRHGPSFDHHRRSPWPGWDRLLPFLPDRPTVLDAGCGNGRLAVFLRLRHRTPRTYLGVDRSLPLLASARRWGRAGLLAAADLTALPLTAHPVGFDLVVLFGVLHHLSDASRRSRLLLDLAGFVAPGGLLAVTAWDFLSPPEIAARVVPWEASGISVDPDDLEPGDLLVAWGATGGLRYVHLLDDAELDALTAPLGFEEVLRFRADGRSGNLNRYRILRRPGTSSRS
jgi:tRNA (uracil-5-)-methyltransferase TRM9